MEFDMKTLRKGLLWCVIGGTVWVVGFAAHAVRYTGKPFRSRAQKIPGRVQAELYDAGGEGVAYHDSDAVNSGSGTLNKGDSDLDRFRRDEAVDISYTKPEIDKTIDGQDEKPGELYLGWTAPGEWVRYTVYVEWGGHLRGGRSHLIPV